MGEVVIDAVLATVIKKCLSKKIVGVMEKNCPQSYSQGLLGEQAQELINKGP